MTLYDFQMLSMCSADSNESKTSRRKRPSPQTLEEYARPDGGRIGPYTEFDWGDGLGFERWINRAYPAPQNQDTH